MNAETVDGAVGKADGRVGFKKSKQSNLIRRDRGYHLPGFHREVECLLSCGRDWGRYRSVNLLFTGPHGAGKTEFVDEIAERCGFARVYHVNGREDMGSGDFLGEQSIRIDQKTLRNRMVFRRGPLFKAFIEGTALDADGDQILDDDGAPVVTGAPGLFFLDEFAALPPGVFLSVFNRVMEIPRNPGRSRVMEISADGGRTVKSHPGFAMILAGNTVGKGVERESMTGYTAQNNIMDDSTLSRITAVYDFSFSPDAEQEIIASALQDERLMERFQRFVSDARSLYDQGKISTLITTRSVVNVMDLYERFYPLHERKALHVALKRALLAGIREYEAQAWKEMCRSYFAFEIGGDGDSGEEDPPSVRGD